MDVAAWLKGLGLERYAAAFRDNEIDWQVLPSLTADDLKEIGVAAIASIRRRRCPTAAMPMSLRSSAVRLGSTCQSISLSRNAAA